MGKCEKGCGKMITRFFVQNLDCLSSDNTPTEVNRGDVCTAFVTGIGVLFHLEEPFFKKGSDVVFPA